MLNSCPIPCYTNIFLPTGICRGLATHLPNASPQLISFLPGNLADRRVARLHHEDLVRLVQTGRGSEDQYNGQKVRIVQHTVALLTGLR